MSAEIHLYIEGKDMSSEVGITEAVYDSYAADYVDTLSLSLQDKDGTWSRWKPKAGERVELTLDVLKTGTLYIHKLRATNGVYHVTARSLPPCKNGVSSRVWEGISFQQLAQAIAGKLGLSLESHGAPDPMYKRIFQEEESDTAFLRRMCHQEGVEMLVYGGKLIVYSPETLEAQGPKMQVTFTGKGDFDFLEREGIRTGAVQVIRTRKKGGESPLDETEETLMDVTATGGEGRTLCFSDLKPTDENEAMRWASGLLKTANRSLKTGKFKLSLQLGLAAGSMVQINNDRATAWNGPVFLYRVRHDLKTETSTLYFRSVGGG